MNLIWRFHLSLVSYTYTHNLSVNISTYSPHQHPSQRTLQPQLHQPQLSPLLRQLRSTVQALVARDRATMTLAVRGVAIPIQDRAAPVVEEENHHPQLHPQLHQPERNVKLVEMVSFVVHLSFVKLAVNQRIVPVSRADEVL